MIRVLLADDHALVRAGFRALLSTLPGIKVVAEAATGNEALALARRHPVDIALLDIGMPGLSGLDALAEMRREFPKIRVIILSMHVNEDYLRRALHDGAAGYVLKDATVAELDTAIRAASRNVRYVSPGIAQVLTEAPTTAPAASAGPERLEQLTRRHREILRLIAEGNTNKKIAARLGISPKTVDAHRTELMARLDIHDVAGLVRYAIRAGLVTSN
jgi:DNA-binding NarL/FixJ family response regulator